MKKLSFLMAMLALALALGLAFVGCDDGTEDGNFDAEKLIGFWKSDTGSLYLGFEFSDSDSIVVLKSTDWSQMVRRTLPINGDVIGNSYDSFKVAFEGEKLRVSESNGFFSGCDGLYTKQ